MPPIGTVTNVTNHHVAGGDTVRLFDRSWWFRWEGRRFGLGASYRRPHAVESSGRRVPVRDPVLVARIVALLAISLALIWRRLT